VCLGIVHGAAEDDAQALLKAVERTCKPAEVIISPITPVLGVHGGPGVVGLVTFNV
jgi:fatty acid-binding protein DegV